MTYPTLPNGFSSALHAIGTPEELHAAADRRSPSAPLRNNAHIHLPPNFSAFDTVAQAVDQASAEHIRVLGASNYYDYTVYGDFASRALDRGIFPLFGLETIALIPQLASAGIKVNDPGNAGKMYLCGKGITRFDPMPDTARALLQVIRDRDDARVVRIVACLDHEFSAAGLDTGLDGEAVRRRVAARHGCPIESVYLQERHAAQAFQEILFERLDPAKRTEALRRALRTDTTPDPTDAVSVQNEIRSRLMKAGRPAYVEDSFVDFNHAKSLVLALGGIPCYPTLGDGTTPICPYEESVDSLVSDLVERGIHAAEFVPVRNGPELLAPYVRAMRGAGLFITAGTEHNTLDRLPIEPTCRGGAPIPDDVRDIFWEGACVVVAHQYLQAHDRAGFVDSEGRPSPAFGSDDERIVSFARLGAAVLERYGTL